MECWSGLSSNRCWKQFRKVILSNFKVFFIHFFQQDVIALIFIPVTGINLFCLYILKDRNSLSVLWKKFFSYFLILPFSPIHPQIRSSHQIVGFRGRSFYISSSLKKKKIFCNQQFHIYVFRLHLQLTENHFYPSSHILNTCH